MTYTDSILYAQSIETLYVRLITVSLLFFFFFSALAVAIRLLAHIHIGYGIAYTTHSKIECTHELVHIMPRPRTFITDLIAIIIAIINSQCNKNRMNMAVHAYTRVTDDQLPKATRTKSNSPSSDGRKE